MFVQNNTLISSTVENTLVRAYTIGNTASKPLTAEDMTALYALYEADTTYAKVAEKFTNDMNTLFASKGSLRATVSQLVTNVMGVAKTDDQIDALIAQYTAKGIDSWSKLYTFWITDTSDEIAQTLVSKAISQASALFPANTAPSFAQRFSLDENTAVGTQVYDANAAPDGTDTGITYALYSTGGIDHLPFTIDAQTGVLLFASVLNYELPVDLGTNNSYDFTIRATNTAGIADQNIQVTIKDAAESSTGTPSQPPATSLTPSIAENTPITTVVFDATVNSDAGVTYSLLNSPFAPSDSALFNIDSQTGKVTFKASPNYEAPLDIGADNVYNFSVRTVSTTTNMKVGSDQAVTLTVTDVVAGDTSTPTTPTTPTVAVPPKGSVVDLGTYGKLIAPVQVDNKWYYAWDMNGDGVHNSAQILTGKYMPNGAVQNAAGTQLYVEDRVSHDVIDALFNKNASGTLGVGGTSDTIRFATLNNVQVALPTAGLSITSGYITNNSLYGDLAEIWDTYNVANLAVGAPQNWYAENYLSATPSSNGHVIVALNGGYVASAIDGIYGYVALQVM